MQNKFNREILYSSPDFPEHVTLKPSNCGIQHFSYGIQARVQVFVFFFAFHFFRGSPALKIAEKMILLTKKVAKCR